MEGYEPSTDAAPWGGEIFVMLTFAQGAAQIAETNAATAAMLTYGQSATEWEPETIASCTRKYNLKMKDQQNHISFFCEVLTVSISNFKDILLPSNGCC